MGTAAAGGGAGGDGEELRRWKWQISVREWGGDDERPEAEAKVDG